MARTVADMRRLLVILAAAASASAIRVPVYGDSKYSSSETVEHVDQRPTYYVSDGAEADSYSMPPSAHRDAASDEDAPASYLVPPPPGPFEDFYSMREGTQSDWLPVTEPLDQSSNEEPEKKVPAKTLKKSKFQLMAAAANKKPHILEKIKSKVPRPSLQLEPPGEAPSQYFAPAAAESLTNIVTNRHAIEPIIVQLPLEQTFEHSEPLALRLLPPMYNFPTKAYPKKYQPFKPVPIPLAEYSDPAAAARVPQARPAPPLTPALPGYPGYPGVYDEKQAFLQQRAQLKRKFKEAEMAKLLELQQAAAAAADLRPVEHEAYPPPPRRAAPPPPAPPTTAADPAPPAPGQRTEFRMHGMNGPHSYQFGFDTGKGKNRQFRYEERDNDGRVKGHYGYVERDGKLRVVNYNADPDTGFQADAPADRAPDAE